MAHPLHLNVSSFQGTFTPYEAVVAAVVVVVQEEVLVILVVNPTDAQVSAAIASADIQSSAMSMTGSNSNSNSNHCFIPTSQNPTSAQIQLMTLIGNSIDTKIIKSIMYVIAILQY